MNGSNNLLQNRDIKIGCSVGSIKQHKKLKGWYTAEFTIKNSNVSSYGPPSESETSSKRGTAIIVTTRSLDQMHTSQSVRLRKSGV